MPIGSHFAMTTALRLAVSAFPKQYRWDGFSQGHCGYLVHLVSRTLASQAFHLPGLCSHGCKCANTIASRET